MTLPTIQNVSRRRAHGYNVRIGSRLYRLVQHPDLDAIIDTALPQPPRVDTAANPEDLRPEAGAIWSMVGWNGGEGQAFFHREASSPTRFWDSRGIDTSPPEPGRPNHLRLLPATASIHATTATNLHLAHDGTALYVTDGTTIFRSTDPLAAAPTFTDDDPHAAEAATTVEHIAPLGSKLYAALGANGIHERDGAWAHWSDLQAVKVWGVKGRVLASTGAALYEAAAAAGSTLLHTLASGETWTDITDAGDFILAAATDGTIYAFTLNEDSGAITLATRTPVTPSESINAIDFHPAGLIFFATEEAVSSGTIGRFYRAALTETGQLSFTAIIRQWGDLTTTSDHTPSFVTHHRESAYVGLQDETGSAHLWRYDLETAGRVRHLDLGGAGSIPSILVHSNRFFATRAGVGLFRESDSTFASTGYIITSLADHFTAERKNWSAVTIDVPTVNGGVVEFFYSTNTDAILDPNHSSWIRARKIVIARGENRVSFSARSRYLAAKIVLTPAENNTDTPSVNSFAFHSFAGSPEVILDIPVNVSDEIHIPGLRRIRAHRLGSDVYSTLRNIEGTLREVVLFDPHETLFGFVEKVTTPIPLPMSARGTRTRVSVVRVRAVRTGQIAVSPSSEAMGLDTMGITILGGVASA